MQRESKSAIVTGASSGLGLQLASLLVEQGYAVVGVARGFPAVEKCAAVSDKNFFYVQGDVATQPVVDSAVSQAQAVGSFKLLVNCAGQGIFGPIGTYDRNKVDSLVNANLVGTILFCEAAVPHLLNTEGTIVNIISTAAMVGRKYESVYCAAKWGVRGYTESLREELRDKPIRIIGVFPGGMQTAFWAKANHPAADSTTYMPPRDVAVIILELISKKNGAYVSDIVIRRT